MKFIWEPKDISCGRVICKPSGKTPFEPCGWSAKWTYKIGFLAGGNPKREYISPKFSKFPTAESREIYSDNNRADYCLIAMTDGMVHSTSTKVELVDLLNKWEMIPMPYNWLVKTMEYLRDLNENGNG